MPSRFDELCRSHLDSYVDAHFGEPVRFLPMLRTPNGRAAPDRDRREIEAVAVLHLRPHKPAVQRDARSAGRDGTNSFRSIVEGTESNLTVQARLFASHEDRPRQGDHVETQHGRFEIVSARDDGTGRLTCQLVALGRPAS